jgi:peroxiredoxin
MNKIVPMLLLMLMVFAGGQAFALEVGDTAPDFKAESTHGSVVLSELTRTGPVVLAFYIADFTKV